MRAAVAQSAIGRSLVAVLARLAVDAAVVVAGLVGVAGAAAGLGMPALCGYWSCDSWQVSQVRPACALLASFCAWSWQPAQSSAGVSAAQTARRRPKT